MAVVSASLSICRSLDDLTPAACDALSEHAREVEFRRGERLIPMGQPPQRLLILTEGLAKLVGISPSGHERILSIYRPGEMVGPAVLMDSMANEHEVVAMSRVRALSISRRDLLIVSRSHPSVVLSLAREVSRQLVTMTERVMTATSAEVPVRLSHLLLEFAKEDGADPGTLVPLEHRLTHEAMAQIIGASRPHTSTVLRDLESVGAVRRKSGRGLLVRPSRLRTIVENGDLHAPFDVESDRLALSA